MARAFRTKRYQKKLKKDLSINGLTGFLVARCKKRLYYYFRILKHTLGTAGSTKLHYPNRKYAPTDKRQAQALCFLSKKNLPYTDVLTRQVNLYIESTIRTSNCSGFGTTGWIRKNLCIKDYVKKEKQEQIT